MIAIKNLHGWDLDPRAAADLQNRLRSLVRIAPLTSRVGHIAGADVAYLKTTGQVLAAVAIFSFPRLELIEEVVVAVPGIFPYVPGLLSFREGPAVLAACARLRVRPDLILFDGQGIAHPRRLGLAAHLGLFLDIPAIGCAKSRLIGEYVEPGRVRGSWSPLRHEGETIGAALRTRDGVRPLFVSPGHLVDLPSSIHWCLATGTGYRLPKPCRAAHNLVTREKVRRAELEAA